MGKNEAGNKAIDLSGCETYQKIPEQQKIFILEYLKDFNARRSGLAAKYSKNAVDAVVSRVLNSAKVQAALAEVSDVIFNKQSAIADAQEITAFLSRIMRGNIKDVCSWTPQGLFFTADSNEIDRETARTIKKVKVTEKSSAAGDWTECKTEVELHDPIRAAELLGRYHGIFKDKLDIGGELKVRFTFGGETDKELDGPN